MKRRDFLKTGAAAAGLVGTLTMEPMPAVAESDSQTNAGQAGIPLNHPTDNRPAEYLHRVHRFRNRRPLGVDRDIRPFLQGAQIAG